MENKKKFLIGKTFKVLGFKDNNLVLRRKMLDMGITKDTVFTIKKVAPFGDRLVIFLRSYYLCINKENLNILKLESLDKK